MSLYSKNGAYPTELPNRIRLSNGSTKTDSSTFTAEDLTDAGYAAVEDKPSAGEFQDVLWDGSDWTTVNWSDIKKSDYQRKIRNELLAGTDIFALSDVTMSSDMETYRQALRDVPSQAGFPDTITWPTDPRA